MDVNTDQHTISQDLPTKKVLLLNSQQVPFQDLLIDQQEISEEWPTEESFERKETLKWRNISDAIYKIQKVKFRKGKYGDSAISTLKTKNGDEFCVWTPKRLTEDLMEDVYYQFVYKKRSQNFC